MVPECGGVCRNRSVVYCVVSGGSSVGKLRNDHQYFNIGGAEIGAHAGRALITAFINNVPSGLDMAALIPFVATCIPTFARQTAKCEVTQLSRSPPRINMGYSDTGLT